MVIGVTYLSKQSKSHILVEVMFFLLTKIMKIGPLAVFVAIEGKGENNWVQNDLLNNHGTFTDGRVLFC